MNDTSIFILSRYFLRIDHVLFRIYDVRIYIDLRTSVVLRELKGRQAPYLDLKAVRPPHLQIRTKWEIATTKGPNGRSHPSNRY